MEKQSPHYDLDEVKAIVGRRGADAFTKTALRGIDDMALTYAEGVMVMLGLQRSMLFKSMTTYADHRVWQDVYHTTCQNDKTAYLKLTLQDGALVIQFKEK